MNGGKCLHSGEDAYVQTGWLVIDRNNKGECFPLTDADGRCVTEATPDRAQALFLAYIRESVENHINVSAANLELI